MTVEVLARTLPAGLAPVVEALELDQPHLVTTAVLDRIRKEAGLATPSNVLAARLRERGWLLPTDRRGVYEFAPAAHAGAISRGDATLPLQAVLTARPDFLAALTFQSAAWALSLADRNPTRLEIAAGDARTGRLISRTLSAKARVSRFAPALPTLLRRGVPVLQPDSLIVHMAAAPRDVRNWESALEWLPEVAAECTAEAVSVELAARPSAIHARLGYLLSGLRPDICAAVGRPRGGTVYFGPREPVQRFDAQRHVADSILPFDPRELAAVP